MRLDRFLGNLPTLNRQQVQRLLASGAISVDGQVCRDGRYEVRDFQRIELDEQLLQAGKAPRYFMLHKPIGVVSATVHDQHRTVLDLLDEPDKHQLHIGGRAVRWGQWCHYCQRSCAGLYCHLSHHDVTAWRDISLH